jgi:hypothetical protein
VELPEPQVGPDPEFVRSVISRTSDTSSLRGYVLESPIPSVRLEALRRLHELGEKTMLKYIVITSGDPKVKEEAVRLLGETGGD